MLPLRCKAQNYEWGRPAATSEVAQLAKAGGADLDEGKPYAELWMGTHPNCPSSIASSGQSLSAWINENPICLGPTVQARFGTNLPFLFKVLSVNKALSIQSHPDKALAERLHREHPKLYADDNHKPEMALALSDGFEALCSFAPLPEIVAACSAQPELAGLVGESNLATLKAAAVAAEPGSEPAKQALRAAFSALMTSEQGAVTEAVSRLVSRLEAKQQQQGQELTEKEALALRLNTQYPGGDVGVLSCFFLNLVRLSRGQAIYLAANEPHAYLAGELMECMAASDNVIRAGLTPKFKHTEVLCESLTYQPGFPEVLTGTPQVFGDGSATVSTYRPPFEEFEIRALQVQGGARGVSLPAEPGPVIMMVQQGSGSLTAEGGYVPAPGLQQESSLSRGTILFVPAGTRLTLSSSEPLLVWVAAVNGTFFALADALAGVATAAVVEALAATATTAIANTTDVMPGPETTALLAEQPAAAPVVQPATAVAVA